MSSETDGATAFPESVKLEARRLAFFRCCYCHDRPGDQVHHLLPKEEGGRGVLDNAIFLCTQCHADYGHRPEKRLQLRQARDHWYEIVAKRYTAEAFAQAERLDSLATKNDVETLLARVEELSSMLKASVSGGTTTAPQLANVASTMVNSIAPRAAFTGWAAGVWAPGAWQQRCGKCNRDLPSAASFCPFCGSAVVSST